MNEFLSSTAGNLATTAAALTAALIALAAMLPKIMNGFKGDGLTGNVLDRLKAMEAHAALQDKKSVQQDVKIHKFAVKVTRLVVVVIRLEALLQANSVDLPQDLIDEIIKIKEEDVEEVTE